ncbi:hypothetical protein QYE76_034625 [Lolium multiflorum]|uniref:Transposase (putative) gypsy type domain-containing protein n=1 Tax=Lolium multiflorum TaxID=4521 RepID=A0AAD8VKE1_LOLMU|nr:hypothetical protein QYE76_034625 [Lolium multiflorum]
MGKKKNTSTSDAAKVSRNWSASAISSRDVNKLRSLGFISASEDDIRLPGAVSRPQPPKGFTVMFVAFLFRGLSLPAHEFLRSLLFFYGIQLWQLTLNSILHLSIFITVCESFLGIDPHCGLWKKVFYVKRDNDSNAPPSSVALALPPSLLNAILLRPKVAWSQRMTMTTPRRPRTSNTPLRTTMSKRKTLPRMMPSLGVGDASSSDDDDDVPLAKRTKLSVGKKASAKKPNPSPAKLTPPTRTVVEKILVSKVIPPGNAPTLSVGRDHPIYATVDAVVDFAEQFTRLEAENTQLRKTVKSSADQVLEANRLATDAKNENALLKEELKKLKRQMKDEQDAKRAAAIATDKKEGVLRESVKELLEAANITVTRRHQLREDSTADALSLAAESNVQVLGLLQKTKGALSRLFSMIFPKMKQDKTLSEMADAFLVDPSEPVEVLKRRSRLYGAVLTFQLLMGHGMGSDLEKLSKALPVDDDNHLVDLEPFKRSAVTFVSSDKSEEDKKIHEKVEAMTDVAHPKHDLWLHRPKAVIMAKFEYRVEKAHYYFDKFHAHLTMVWKTLFPLDQAPETLSALFTRFKSPERIRLLCGKNFWLVLNLPLLRYWRAIHL